MITRPNLILIGFMGSGKTTVGRMAGRKLRFQFLDTDNLIAERAGMDVAEIFAKSGEEAFRRLETRALESIAPLTRYVVSTGGGAVLREENRKLLRSMGFVILLTAREEVIHDRVAHQNKRPLLQTEDPRGTIARLMEERREAYESTAHLVMDTSDFTQEQTSEAVINAARQAFGWQPAEVAAVSQG